jgi:hypothetical protein
MMPSIAGILFSLRSSSSCYFERPKLRWKNNIRVDLKWLGMMVWIEYMWVGLGSSGMYRVNTKILLDFR